MENKLIYDPVNHPTILSILKASVLHIECLKENEEAPFHLLKLADPSISKIKDYLSSGRCYLAQLNTETIGVMVLNEKNTDSIEIENIAIKASFQGRGFGKKLLQYADKISREAGYKKPIIATGNSSIGQMLLYQKEGFEMKCIEKNYFVRNYEEPIFENGIQCKHRVILEKILNDT